MELANRSSVEWHGSHQWAVTCWISVQSFCVRWRSDVAKVCTAPENAIYICTILQWAWPPDIYIERERERTLHVYLLIFICSIQRWRCPMKHMDTKVTLMTLTSVRVGTGWVFTWNDFQQTCSSVVFNALIWKLWVDLTAVQLDLSLLKYSLHRTIIFFWVPMSFFPLSVSLAFEWIVLSVGECGSIGGKCEQNDAYSHDSGFSFSWKFWVFLTLILYTYS